MAKKFRTGRFLFIAILIIVVAVFAFTKYSGKLINKDNALAATVNGYEITKSYVETRYSLLPDTLKATVTYDDFLGQTIDSFLIFQEAEREGYSITDAELDSRISRAMASTGLDEAGFNQKLLSEGITPQEFRADLKRNIIVGEFLSDKIISLLEVSDEDVEKALSETPYQALNLSEAEARLQLSGQLKALKAQRAIATLLDQLRSKAEIVRK